MKSRRAPRSSSRRWRSRLPRRGRRLCQRLQRHRCAPRVVAVGDVHGAYDRFVAILRTAGILDDKGRWAGGSTHLVQVGDVLDRGVDTRRSLDLLMRLQGEA